MSHTRSKKWIQMNRMLHPIERAAGVPAYASAAWTERKIMIAERVRKNLLTPKSERRDRAHINWLRTRAKHVKKIYPKSHAATR